jgi:hypothetical protein
MSNRCVVCRQKLDAKAIEAGRDAHRGCYLKAAPASEAPDLQSFVLAHGGYDNITPEAWAGYDARLDWWRADMRVLVEQDRLTAKANACQRSQLDP